MSKMILVTIVAVLLGSLSACAPHAAVNASSEEIPGAASQIADFDLPSGYTSEFTAHLAGYTVVAYNPGDGHSHLYLIQSEKETDSEKLAQMLADMVPGSGDPKTRLTVIENRSMTVRGQTATLVTSDAVNHVGDAYRQVTLAFRGKGGPALLVFSEPTERWDQGRVDALLASIQ